MREKRQSKPISLRAALAPHGLETPEQGVVMADLRRPIDDARPGVGGRAGQNASTDDLVIAVAGRLRSEFGSADAQYVERRVRDEFGRWQDARVTQYVPLLVERNVRDELRGVGGAGLPR
jgi:hypothetical protein